MVEKFTLNQVNSVVTLFDIEYNQLEIRITDSFLKTLYYNRYNGAVAVGISPVKVFIQKDNNYDEWINSKSDKSYNDDGSEDKFVTHSQLDEITINVLVEDGLFSINGIKQNNLSTELRFEISISKVWLSVWIIILFVFSS